MAARSADRFAPLNTCSEKRIVAFANEVMVSGHTVAIGTGLDHVSAESLAVGLRSRCTRRPRMKVSNDSSRHRVGQTTYCTAHDEDALRLCAGPLHDAYCARGQRGLAGAGSGDDIYLEGWRRPC